MDLERSALFSLKICVKIPMQSSIGTNFVLVVDGILCFWMVSVGAVDFTKTETYKF